MFSPREKKRTVDTWAAMTIASMIHPELGWMFEISLWRNERVATRSIGSSESKPNLSLLGKTGVSSSPVMNEPVLAIFNDNDRHRGE